LYKFEDVYIPAGFGIRAASRDVSGKGVKGYFRKEVFNKEEER